MTDTTLPACIAVFIKRQKVHSLSSGFRRSGIGSCLGLLDVGYFVGWSLTVIRPDVHL